MAKKKAATKNRSKKTKRSKKSKLSPYLIVGGVFALMIGIIVVSVINIKLKNLENKYSEQTHQNETDSKKSENTVISNISDIEEKIKLFLYDHEISKNNILSKYINLSEETKHLHYTVKVNSQKYYSVKKSFINFFESRNFTYREKKSLLFKNSNIMVSINLKEISPVTASESTAYTPKGFTQEDQPDASKTFKAKMGIILDDSGYSLDLAKKAVQIEYPLTLSIIPYTEFDSETADIARKNENTVFLHQPMQPRSYPDTDPGKGAILLNTPEALIKILVKKNVEQIGKIDGVNNHMGSALTENSKKMTQSLKFISSYTDTFVDSHTSADTVAYDICKSDFGMICGISEKFIDNSADEKYIEEKLFESARLALKNKSIIVIGHLRPATVSTLTNVLPKIEALGVKIVPVKEVIN